MLQQRFQITAKLVPGSLIEAPALRSPTFRQWKRSSTNSLSVPTARWSRSFHASRLARGIFSRDRQQFSVARLPELPGKGERDT
jgi:hypothetical protein